MRPIPSPHPFPRAVRVAAALALAGALALSAIACRPGKAAAEKAKKEGEIRKAAVQAGDFRIEVSATGKVKPFREVEVLSKASGQIIEMPFELGAHVAKGALLVRLDPQDESRRVQQSEAQLESTKARLEKAKSQLELVKSSSKKSAGDADAAVKVAETRLAEAKARHDRQKNLFERKLISQEVLEAADSALAQATADLTRAETNLEDVKNLPFQIASQEQDIQLAKVEVGNALIALADAKRRLADTEIIASMDGVITDRKVETGRVITSATSGFGGGTLLLTLADLSTLYLVTAVDESDIGGVALGQRAEISTDAFPGQKFAGEVAHIAPVGITLNSVVTFDVKVRVLGEGIDKLKPGMTADVTIVTQESPATFWVQSDAVRDGENGESFVEKLEADGKRTKIPVTRGLTDGLRAEVKGDLKEGLEVVIADENLTAWQKGEGTNRPMKGFNPFGGGDKKKKEQEEKEKAEKEKNTKLTPAEKRAQNASESGGDAGGGGEGGGGGGRR